MDMDMTVGSQPPIKTEEDHDQFDNNPPATVPVYDYAGFWMRLWAYLVDLIVVGSLNRMIIYPLLRLFDIPIAEASIFSLSVFLTWIVGMSYFVFMTKRFGQTLGKMLFGLRVVSSTKDNLSWIDVIFREVIGKFISKTVLFGGYIAVAFTSKKQGLHDYFADTFVIHEK